MEKNQVNNQMHESLWLCNPFVPKMNFRKPSKACEDTDEHKYIYSRELKDVYEKVGDSKTDFVVSQEVVETSKINRQEYIDSFKDDVGILNILRKVVQTGDLTLLNERVRSSVPVGDDGKEQIVDISGIDNPESVRSYLGNMNKVLNSMPADVRDAVINMDGEQLKAFLENLNKPQEVKKDE